MRNRLCGALILAQLAAYAVPAQAAAPPGNNPQPAVAGANAASLTASGKNAGRTLIAISPRTLDFGSVPVGTTEELSFTVRNLGAASLVCTGTVSAPFHIVGGNSFVLTNSETRVITVQYSPNAMGVYASVVRLTGASGAGITVTGSGARRLPSRPTAPASPRNLRLIAAH